MEKKIKTAIIIGAGPAGLSAAYGLLKMDIKPVILEELDVVGGIARTVVHNGNGVDLGGHRLFSKSTTILDLWENLLPLQGKPAIDYKLLDRNVTTSPAGPDPDKTDRVMLKRERLSRIYYENKFFDYPISLNIKTMTNMGIKRIVTAGCSYLKSCIIKRQENSLEDFMINRFGKVLYELFFEKYTQKVWGLHPKNISKEWGEQRIKGLSLHKVLLNAFASCFNKSKNEKETSLIREYYYPKYGCGQLWSTMADEIVNHGGEIHYNSKVIGFKNSDKHIESVIIKDNNNNTVEFCADYIISSMPIKDLIKGLNDVPSDVSNIAENLPYRDYILVGFYLDKFNLKNNTNIKTINNICPDNWIYLQDEYITAGRLQIMNNWSPYLVKDFQNKVFISLEYFATEGDSLWEKTEKEMLAIALKDIHNLNLAEKENILDTLVIKVKKAYPAYFGIYSQFDKIKDFLNNYDNLYCIGRNGQHKYNNMDHSMLSGLEAAWCIKNNTDKNILWNVNTEKEYHECK